MNDPNEIVLIEKSSKRTLTEIEKEVKDFNKEWQDVIFDMRIVGEMVTDSENIAKFRLIFRLDYRPKDYIDHYYLFSVLDVGVWDKYRVIENHKFSPASIDYFAQLYKINGERLFREINEKAREKGMSWDRGNFVIDINEAKSSIVRIFQQYFT